MWTDVLVITQSSWGPLLVWKGSAEGVCGRVHCPGSCRGREGIKSFHVEKLTLGRVKFPRGTEV